MFTTIRMFMCGATAQILSSGHASKLCSGGDRFDFLSRSSFFLVPFSSSGKISRYSLELDRELFLPVTFQNFIHPCPLFRTIRLELKTSLVNKHKIHKNACCYGREWPKDSRFPGF